MFKNSKSLLVLAILIVSGMSCNKSTDMEQPYGLKVLSFSDCKITYAKESIVEPSQACLVYSYDGDGTLTLNHINADFNCCISDIEASISVDSKEIDIQETAALDNGGCDCFCYYDVETQLEGLSDGEYTVTVTNGGSEFGQQLSFTADLEGVDTDTVCIPLVYILD